MTVIPKAKGGAVITARNESETIGNIVRGLVSQGLEVCVVDDGSTDETGDIAFRAGAWVIHHNESRGIGKSLVEAWRYAIKNGWDYTVQIDAGGSHSFVDWRLSEYAGDLIIGSRFTDKSLYIGRKWRAIASQIVAKALNFATHKNISDWTSGYRIFSRRALEALVNSHYLTNMHTWQIEVLGEAIRKGLTITEFPITYRAGDSTMKLKTVSDLVKVYLWILNL